MLLRRLAGSNPPGPLETLAGLVEPVKVYRRGIAHPSTQFTPLTRLVDVAVADPPAGRELSALVDQFLAGGPRFDTDYDRLKLIFAEWRNTRPTLEILMTQSPILQEAKPLSSTLFDLGESGTESLEYLYRGASPPVGWKQSKLNLLTEAARPSAEVEFSVIEPLKKLVNAAGDIPRLN